MTYLHGLADTSALDHEVVKAAIFGKLGNLPQQIFPQGTADAPILHLNQLLLHLHAGNVSYLRR